MQRDWTEARQKVVNEGKCRFCGRTPEDDGVKLEAVHIWGREVDRFAVGIGSRVPHRLPVSPVKGIRIVPGCKECHEPYDKGEKDLLPRLTVEEQAQAVLDAGGLELARRRTCPIVYREGR